MVLWVRVRSWEIDYACAGPHKDRGIKRCVCVCIRGIISVMMIAGSPCQISSLTYIPKQLPPKYAREEEDGKKEQREGV